MRVLEVAYYPFAAVIAPDRDDAPLERENSPKLSVPGGPKAQEQEAWRATVDDDVNPGGIVMAGLLAPSSSTKSLADDAVAAVQSTEHWHTTSAIRDVCSSLS